MRPLLAFVSAVALAAATLGAPAVADPSSGRSPAEGPPDDRYLVVLEDGVPAAQVAAEQAAVHDSEASHVYEHALNGFAMALPAAAAAQLEADPRVRYVDEDAAVWTAHHECGHSGGPGGGNPDAHCEDGDVSGSVTDEEGTPVEGATVEADGTQDETDEHGDYELALEGAAEVEVTAEKDGVSETATIEVDGDVEDVDFVLDLARDEDDEDDEDGDEEEDDGDADDEVAAETVPWGVERVGATEAHDDGATGDGVAIYVLDTGIDPDHPDLNVSDGVDCTSGGGGPGGGGPGGGGPPGNSDDDEDGCDDDGWDDVDGHGTHVAGTAAATLGGEVVGVAPEATLHAVQVLGDDGSGTQSDVIAGIDHVAEQAGEADAIVANMSLGGAGEKSGSCDGGDFDGDDAYHEAICSATAKGVVFAVAAGNDGEDAEESVPAAYADTTIAVSATNCGDQDAMENEECPTGDDAFEAFSNYGEPVAIAAPGVVTYSTVPGGDYAHFSGTSMASPHVAGAIALLLADETVTASGFETFTDAQDALVEPSESTDEWDVENTFDLDDMDDRDGGDHHEGFLDVGAALGG